MLVCFKSTHLFLLFDIVGTLVGITNTMASVPGFVAPYVVGAITYQNVRILKKIYFIYLFI